MERATYTHQQSHYIRHEYHKLFLQTSANMFVYYFTTLDSEAMIVVKLADKEDMIVCIDIGMLALFSSHPSHGLLYFRGSQDSSGEGGGGKETISLVPARWSIIGTMYHGGTVKRKRELMAWDWREPACARTPQRRTCS
jgi:hypothetical protein